MSETNRQEKEDGRSMNNQVRLAGKIISGFEYSHETFYEKFYNFLLEVPRLSETVDVLNVVVSERLVDVGVDCTGKYVSVEGQFRSYNKAREDDQVKKSLILRVFAQELNFIDNGDVSVVMSNVITLKGYTCKPAVYRKTPLGREISDVMLAVNRAYKKSDYIPCICWGRNARFVSGLDVGAGLEVSGRIQSREYKKALPDGETITRTAYEVSVSKVGLWDGTEERVEEQPEAQDSKAEPETSDAASTEAKDTASEE